MKNNIEPEEEKYGWNSSKEAVPGLTCLEAAGVLTSFSSTFRALVMIDHQFGFESSVIQAAKMLQAQIDNCNDQGLVGKKREAMMEKTSLAIGMALISIGAANPQAMGLLASQAIEALIDVQKKLGVEKFNSSIIRFNVRKVEAKSPEDRHGLEIGAEVVSMEKLTKGMEEVRESSLIKEAEKIVNSVIEDGSKRVDPSSN